MEFICKIGTPAGRVRSQVEQAASASELRQRLAAEGYYVFSVRAKDRLRAPLGRRPAAKIRDDDFLVFNEQFLTLSKSGLPLHKSLELLARQSRRESLRAALDEVRERVRAGALLSEAFEAAGRFPRIYAATLRAGERSGSLDRVLAQYVAYQKVSRSFRKKFLAALIYPAFLVVFLGILIAFVVGFIVPRFAELYADIGAQLPAPTVFVISVSLAFRRYAVAVFALLIAAAAGLRAAWRSARGRLLWDRLRYRLPAVGPLLLKFSVAEFARTLATLLQGGAPIVAALETARQSVSSPLLIRALGEVQKEVTSGQSLSGSLRRTGFFPPTAIDMIEVGEGTGALPAMLESLAEFFEEDVNVDLATLVALVDPVMIAIIAVVVAFVLVAFYLPLFSMAGQVH